MRIFFGFFHVHNWFSLLVKMEFMTADTWPSNLWPLSKVWWLNQTFLISCVKTLAQSNKYPVDLSHQTVNSIKVLHHASLSLLKIRDKCAMNERESSWVRGRLVFQRNVRPVYLNAAQPHQCACLCWAASLLCARLPGEKQIVLDGLSSNGEAARSSRCENQLIMIFQHGTVCQSYSLSKHRGGVCVCVREVLSQNALQIQERAVITVLTENRFLHWAPSRIGCQTTFPTLLASLNSF